MLASHRYATIPAILMLAAGLIAARGEPPETAKAEPGVIRDGYETDRPSWQQEYTDTTVRLLAHERSDRAAHGGRTSERFRFEAGQGSRFFVSQALPKIPVTEDLAVSLYVRSNRQGAQIFGWVVLPEDIDPETKAPSFLLVPGGVFSRPDRWEKLSLAEMRPAIEEQARVLRAFDPTAGLGEGGLRRARRGQPDGRHGRDGRLPRRSPDRPRSRRSWPPPGPPAARRRTAREPTPGRKPARPAPSRTRASCPCRESD